MEIAQTEIDSLREGVTSAYDLIRRLRPTMLSSRDPRLSAAPTRELSPETSGVGVYLDGVYVGGLDLLSSIPARSITSIRRISSATASTQFGAGLSAGAIVITTEVPSSRPRIWMGLPLLADAVLRPTGR
jgi:hypothetical protein